MPDFDNQNIANSLKALSHPRRMAIFRLLSAHPTGTLSFKALQTATRLSTTTLVHHLREMERAWLISRKRKGPEAFYRMTPQSLLASMENVHSILTVRYASQIAA